MKIRSLLFATIVTFALSASAKADDTRDDWIIRMQTESLERQFAYAGSKLNKVAKITIDYYAEKEPDKKTKYEMMWFSDGKPLGLERQNDLEIPAGNLTKIQVLNKKGTTPEIEKAIANAILRISLDAYLKRTPILSFKVPKESYDGIVAAMNNLNCVASKEKEDEADTSIMSFSIETYEQEGPATMLCYY